MATKGNILENLIPQILETIKPENFIKESLRVREGRLTVLNETVDIQRFKRIVVYGYGKASYNMFKAVTDVLYGWIDEYYIIIDKRIDIPGETSENILYGVHPLPDEETVESSKKLLESAESLGEDELAINLISGGGSSIFEVPYHSLSLDDIIPIWETLMSKGCDINRLNTVRRHMSLVKGGRFAASVYPGYTLSLILSDVVGDPIHDIASGPTAPDPTTYSDAYHVIREFALRDDFKAVKFLLDGVKGRYPETLKPGDKVFRRTKNIIIGGLNHLAIKLGRNLERLGYKMEIAKVDIQGNVDDVARYIATYLEMAGKPDTIYIFGGEAYSRVFGEGIGGPNHELTLKLYNIIRKLGLKAEILCMDTDGVDGNSPSAGGYLNTYSIEINEKTIENYLVKSDSYTLLKSIGYALETGPTGSNLNSIWIIHLTG